MAIKLFASLKKTAAKFGSSDPSGLKAGQEFDFIAEEQGDSGPELLLLHGLLGAVSNWDYVLPLFAQYTKSLGLQLPILTGEKEEVKIKSLAHYTERYIRQKKIAPVAICGNSLGGHVAMRLYLAHPELVDCLILSGTSGLYEHTVDALPVRPDEKFLREHMARVFYHEKFITDEAIQEVLEILKSRANTLNIIHAARSAKRDNLLHELKNIKVPVLLLWGEDDQVTTMDVAQTFHKHIPNSKLVTIKGCGHAPMIEHPEWFSEEVHKFLKEHSRFFKNL